MPNYWLLKTEPATYSFQRLQAEGTAVWDGVRNNLALKHLRGMAVGDKAFIYHSGADKAIVGVARVTRAAYPDPSAHDANLVVVDLQAEGPVHRPVPLSAIKADAEFKEFALVRMSRLSVMPVSAEHWKRLNAMAR